MRSIVVLLAFIPAIGACNPVAPTRTFVCLTQPRAYVNPNSGVVTWEVDHYTQSEPCPTVRIR